MTAEQTTREANFRNRSIWTADNLGIMRGMNSASIDLIYLDPPFNSNANYAAPIGSIAAGAEFKDTWTLNDVDAEWINLIKDRYPALQRVLLAAMTKSDKSYLVYMAVRLLEMKRLLKDNGSIYLHCDPTMSHYLKLVMDAIFGRAKFRNEIVWCYKGAGYPKKDFGKRHDVIFRYVQSNEYTFNLDSVRENYAQATKDRFKHYIGNKRKGRDFGLQALNPLGKHPDDWWEIQPIAPSANERTGYPTQKPLELLDKIIKASSNEGDLVFDPFCGCATTLVAADRLQRQWAGIDVSKEAVRLVKQRLKEDRGIEGLVQDVIARTDIPQRTDLGKLPRYNAPENRKQLYGEQGGHCAGCEGHFEARHLEIDHIISRNKGGTDHIENLQLLCGSCNRIKGDRGMEYLRVSLQL